MHTAGDRTPSFFRWLQEENLIGQNQIYSTSDGFSMVTASLSSILASRGIETFPDREDQIQQCRFFFDDWFLYAVPDGDAHCCSLLKMREQEHDRELGISADGDTPGVTVSFIAFDAECLKTCLEDPSASNRKGLGIQINTVAAYPGQSHHSALKAYFIRPEAEAAYLIGEIYTAYIASFSTGGVLPVPDAYKEIFRKREKSPKYARIPDFLDKNNADARAILCDHQRILIQNPAKLTDWEKLAILATHTGNVSFHSFAAEVRFHAMFLTPAAKIRIPLMGSAYASALRADMSIADKEFQGPTPYYNLSGKLVREQIRLHPSPCFDLEVKL